MPLPLILGAAAAVAGLAGVGSAIHGGAKMKEANDTIKSANYEHEKNKARFERKNKKTTEAMDILGTLELEVLDSFSKFSSIMEKIQNKPEFKNYEHGEVKLPVYNEQELNRVSVGAGVLLGGIGGAAVGTAGGFAAAGATTAAVMALGTASTGTAIATLSGAAATNATLAALGGGAIAAGGGGMALGSAVLGAATLGVGLLVGGIIFNVTGSKLSDKADEAYRQMKNAKKEIDKICNYLTKLYDTEKKFEGALSKVNKAYTRHLDKMGEIVLLDGKTDWNNFTDQEKKVVENTVLLVSLLYKMCKTKLVLVSNEENALNTVNEDEVNGVVQDAENFMEVSGLGDLA